MVDKATLEQLEEMLEKMPTDKLRDKDLEQIYGLVTGRAYSPIWNPLPGPQTEAEQTLADELFYGGSAGGGKGQALDADVLTPFGYRKMRDLKIGSVLSNPNGGASKVLQIFPLGKKQLYKVEFHDGTSTEVTDDHIWLAWRVRIKGEKSARLWTTKNLIDGLKKKWKFRIPTISKPISFTVSSRYPQRPIHPYLLGVLLGDGGLAKMVSITSSDPQVISNIRKKTDVKINGPYGPYEEGQTCSMYVIPGREFKDKLIKLDLLGRDSYSKFIPKYYLYAPIKDRWELMRGLIDTDGWSRHKGALYYSTCSRKLKEGIIFLARSLGAFVTWQLKKTKTQDGVRVRSFTIRVKFRKANKAVELNRKRNKCSTPQSMGRSIVSITPTRETECQCIKVSHPNGLYITNDFIVTHNSDLLIGLSLTKHKRSCILRREGTDLGALAERMKNILGRKGSWRGIGPFGGQMRTYDGRMIELRSCKNEDDKEGFQGNVYDFHGFDELPHFTYSQYQYIIGWNRPSTDMKQRCRVVCAGNPPTTAEGRWVIKAWAPWLDKNCPVKATPGELKWYTTIAGEIKWFDTNEKVVEKGEPIILKSKTFIPARLRDNPVLAKTGYISVIQAFPEPLRSQLLYGDMNIGVEDHEWQVIPSQWVKDAQRRWSKYPPPGTILDCLGVDVARGGPDKTALVGRHGHWFGKPKLYKGTDTPNGYAVANLVQREINETCKVHIDVTGGHGGSPYDILQKVLGERIIAVVFSQGTEERTKDKTFGFANVRALMWWRMREALDPTNDYEIALPPDDDVFDDLTAPRYNVTPRGILVQSKDEIKEKIGRSTDVGDALVMANWIPRKKRFWIL